MSAAPIDIAEARRLLAGPLPRRREWIRLVGVVAAIVVIALIEAWWRGEDAWSSVRSQAADNGGLLTLVALACVAGGLWWRRERGRLAAERDVERVVVREATDLGRGGGTSVLVEAPDGLRARWTVRGHDTPVVGEELVCTPLRQDHLVRAAWRGPAGGRVLEPETPVNIEWNPRWRAHQP